YKFQPLCFPHEIRLLHFEKRISGNIHCQIQHIRLSAIYTLKYEYEALSYAWGSKVSPRPIYVNNEAHLASKILYTALENLHFDHDRNQYRILWVDAICINQQDNVERNQQVKEIGTIYSKARRTLIWVGK
ncbi:hypothetical protein EJ08DRAFT_567797, partial [Tothia fuscella]